MRLALCLCCFLFQVSAVTSRLFTRLDTKLIHNSVSSPIKSTNSSASLMQIRQRPLFARRVYERQRVYDQKTRNHLGQRKGPPAKDAPPIPGGSQCSKLSESCLPQYRCCDRCASCHCRFFNTICFCRRTNSLCGRNA